MPYTVDALTSDCYPGTTVLVNRFDLKEQKELDLVEAYLVTAKAAQWEEAPQCGAFDVEHYKAIHRHLFCDLYEWAGSVRKIDISKKGTCFCPAEQIERVGNAIFQRLQANGFLRGRDHTSFVDGMLDLYERTNEWHPFREGNGRTQRVFLAQLAQSAGYELDFSSVDADELMIATIYAANGMEELLRTLLSQMIKKSPE